MKTRLPRTALAALVLTVAVLAAWLAPLAGATAQSCPTTNPPDELVLSGGSPQTAKLDGAFDALQVSLANSNGCAVTTSVAGTVITFSAPSSGASGSFASSGSSSLSLGSDSSGNASASGFTANDVAGSYTVTASSSYGSVSFSLTNTAAGSSATITPQAPSSQQATVGDHYASPLAVQVLDANGNPVEGASVTFTLGSGGGGGGASGASSSAGASFDGGSATASEQTNASGIATSPLFSANDVPGSFSASASTAGVTEPASFTLDNLAGAPPTLKLVAGRRSAVVDTRYRNALEVKVLGAGGVPVEGTTVTFSLAASGGGAAGGSTSAGASFLGGSTQATGTTDAAGIAISPNFVANGSVGQFTATISVPGLRNPLTVTLENLAARVARVGGTRRSAVVSSRYVRPLEVKVVGANGRPVAGASVTFSLASAAASGGAGGSAQAGASFLDGSAQASETTSASGLAVSPLFAANASAGTFTATASVSGAVNPVTFTLDNLAGAGPGVVTAADPPRTATVGDHYRSPLEVTVRGGNGKPLQGASVTFTLGGGAGAGSAGAASAGASFLGGSAQATETTNAAGRAVSPAFIADSVAGVFTATATVSGTTHVASFPLRNLAGRPDKISVGAAASESATVSTRFAVGLAVTVTDSDSNAVAGAVVTFSAPSRGASGRFERHGQRVRVVRVRTNSDGIAVAPAFVANAKPGGYVVTASAGGARAAFALVNDPSASA